MEGTPVVLRLWASDADREAVEAAVAELAERDFGRRLWARDAGLWKDDAAHRAVIENALGWLTVPADLRDEVAALAEFADEVRADGVRHLVLLGMGGSSLAPEMFSRTFATAPGHLRVTVLDCTDPDAVLLAEQRFDPSTTLYLVSTKSGGTVETLSFFKYFHALSVERIGAARAARHFAAVTDPGSSLETTARALGVREVFLNDPDIGGRFSALTLFGLVPAALGGVDLQRLLGSAGEMARRCAAGTPDAENPGLTLGALVGGLALAGRNKLTLVCSRGVGGFGAWAEQLVAESTGKEGRGILPVNGEVFAPGRRFGADRVFVFLQLDGDAANATPEALAADGHPVLRLRLRDAYDLGGELFRWEFATAVMGALTGVNPFDQPDVESAKVQANRALAAYRESGSLPAPSREVPAQEAAVEIARLLAGGRPGDYVAVQAFVDPGAFDAALREFGAALGLLGTFPVTIGYGPRFLHSTGQLHKGGPPEGIFVQLVTANPLDAPIPDDFGSRAGSVGFGVLKAAQSLGDLRALEAARRRVVRIHLGNAGPEAVLRLDAITRSLRR